MFVASIVLIKKYLRVKSSGKIAHISTSHAKGAQHAQKSKSQPNCILAINNISKYIGDIPLIENFTFQITRGMKIGVIGSNGSGKTSLLRIIAGQDVEYEGETRPAKGIRVGLFSQDVSLDPDKTVMDNVLSAFPEQMDVLKRYEEMLTKSSSENDPEWNRIQNIVSSEKLLDLRRRIDVSLKALRCADGSFFAKNLSGGEARRVALCRLLISNPDLLLLDEPTNHLDTQSVVWLEHFLSTYRGSVLAVTHDRYFLDNVSRCILEMDRGKIYPFTGCYSKWLSSKNERLVLESRKNIALSRQIERELEWIRSSSRNKNQGRINRLARLLKTQTELRAHRELEVGNVVIPSGPPLGNNVLRVEGLSMSFENKIIIKNLTFSLLPRAIMGIVGPNGAGKTTLLRIIKGELSPDAGNVHIGSTVRLASISQSRTELQPNQTVIEAVSEGDPVMKFEDRDIPVRAYLSSYNIKGSMQERKISELSGGERNRVLMAKMLRDGCNLIMLDEPTNDLDVDTLRSLEDALSCFEGSAIIVSHDRWFLDRVCTHIMFFSGEGNAQLIEGGFSDYMKVLEAIQNEKAKKGDHQAPFLNIAVA